MFSFTSPPPTTSHIFRRSFPLPSLRRPLLARRQSRTGTPLATAASSSAPAPTPFRQLFSDPASDKVLDLSNSPTSLISYVDRQTTENRAVLLGWLRHYGCTLCKKQAADWAKLAPRLAQCGDITVALIGNGTVEQANDFVRELQWKGDLFTDPSRTTYKALQFAAGVGVTFTAGGLIKVIQSFREGNKQTWSRLPTDAFQQGGAILVDFQGKVSLFHRDAFAGDHIDVEQLYKASCAACSQAVPS